MAKQADPLLILYRGPNLSALALGLAYIPLPSCTVTQFSIFLNEAATLGSYIFTIYKREAESLSWTVLTTVTIASGDFDGYSAVLTEACSLGDTLRVDLTTLPAGATVHAPVDIIVDWERTINADDADNLGGVSAATYQAAMAAASVTETLLGTEATKKVTPDALAGLWEKGSDIASSGTISIGEGGYFDITGTTTISTIGFANNKTGREACLKFNGILTLTHHATNLILPSGANIITAAGDVAVFKSEGTNQVRCVSYQRADGTALVGGTSYTDEMAQDAVGGILSDTGDIDFTYDDATPAISGVVKNDSVTYAKMQNVSAASKLLGRGDSGSGDVQEITLGTGLSMSGTTLNATASGGGSGTFLIDDGDATGGGTFTFDDGDAT